MTLLPEQEGGVACAYFPVLNDTLALEGEEQFQVTFALEGTTGDADWLTLSGGRAEVVPGLSTAIVTIQDQNSML